MFINIPGDQVHELAFQSFVSFLFIYIYIYINAFLNQFDDFVVKRCCCCCCCVCIIAFLKSSFCKYLKVDWLMRKMKRKMKREQWILRMGQV